MLRYADYDIVFREIPDEVTLAVNLTGCPNRCPGCHSPYLQRDEGQVLTEEVLCGWLRRYEGAVTCLCFMGGDGDPARVAELARSVREQGLVKTAWYSGRTELPADCDREAFDFIKLGPYVERLGALDRPTTNQRLYRIERGADGRAARLVDITSCFWRQ